MNSVLDGLPREIASLRIQLCLRRHDDEDRALAVNLQRHRWENHFLDDLRSDGKPDEARRLGLLNWALEHLARHFSLPPSDMHRWLAERFDSFAAARGQKVNCVGPRGSAKSTVATLAGVLRTAVERCEPYIWIVSDTCDQACAHLENLKAELTDNERLAAEYPAACGVGPVWRRDRIVLRNGVAVEAYGTGQRVRGRRLRQHRPTLIVCDDLQDNRHIHSALQREHARAWFHGALVKAGSPETCVVNLATALHRDALAMELDRAPGWVSRLFRAIEAWPKRIDLWHEWEALYCDAENERAAADALAFYEANREAMHEGSAVLWPEREDLYLLMAMQAESGRTAFAREKQSSPIDPESCEWPEEYFGEEVWEEEAVSGQRTADSKKKPSAEGRSDLADRCSLSADRSSLADRCPLTADSFIRILAVDPSKGSDARRGDYSAIVALAIDREGIMHVEADLARRPTAEIVAQTVEWCRRFAPHAVGIEANQFQDLLAGELNDALRAAGLGHIAAWKLNNQVPKQVRIRRIGPYLAGRRLRFRSGSPGTRLLVDQLRDFPNGDHDDGPDALEMAIRLATQLTHGRAGDGLGERLIGRL